MPSEIDVTSRDEAPVTLVESQQDKHVVLSEATKKRKYSELEDQDPLSDVTSHNDNEDEVAADLREPSTLEQFQLKSPLSSPKNQSRNRKTPRKHSQENVAKTSLNEPSVTERKRIFVWKRPAKVAKAMQDLVTQTYDLLDPFREDDECWIHPNPQTTILLPSGVERARGHISKNFAWTDEKGSHSLRVNFGIVAKLVSRKITQRQKDGFITQGWHLSHLCGNWTCLNPEHMTVEKGSINAARNTCFSHRGGCRHSPPCMKEKKLALEPNGQVQSQDPEMFCFENHSLHREESQDSFEFGENENDTYLHHFSEPEDIVEGADEDSSYGSDDLLF